MANILVLEDQKEIREFVVINIKRQGHIVFEASSGEEALRIFDKNSIDVAVLDVMLPGINGFEVCKRMRGKNKYIGIIMLTAKTQEDDKLTGLMSGADDYMVKPFSPKELMARIDSLLRRVNLIKEDTADVFEGGPYKIDFEARQVFKDGVEVDLTQIEFSIISLLTKNAGKSLSREEILDNVWGENFFGSFKIVDVNIRRLRQKLEDDASNPEYILTVWGYGYRFKR